MAHLHNVYDTDIHFSINPITRVIKNETLLKIMLIQGDHNSERFSFDMPRFIEGHDMTLCNEIEIHYNNIDAMNGNPGEGVYEVDDIQVHKDDQEKVVFSWLIREEATQNVGILNFLILFKCTSNGVVDYKWHTGINKEISVGNGMNNGGVITERYPDILTQWHEKIFGDAENAVSNINNAGKNALEAVRAESAAQIENVKKTAQGIEAERKQIHLNNALKAAVINGSAEGEVIVLDDSAEQPFGMFHVFGKSEQSKTTGKNLLNIEEDCTFEGYLIISANIPAGSYILSLEDLVRGGQYQPYVHFVDNNIGTYLYSATKETEITLPQDETEVRIYSNNFSASGSAGVSATLQRLMLSAEGGTYEPFTGGIPSPNPEYPQEINSVENPEVVVCGKNLIYEVLHGYFNTESLNFTEEEGYRLVKSFIPKAGKYTFSIFTEQKMRIVRMAIGEEIIKLNLDQNTYTFEVFEQTEAWFVFRECEYSALQEHTVQVEFGEGLTEHEAYKTPQVVSIPHTLHAIPVTSGGNYTDAEGQQWICDEVDLERGVLVQRIKEFVLGELNADTWYTWGVDYSTEGITGFYHYYTDDVLMDFVLCNIGVYGSKTWGGLSVGVGASASSKYLTISVHNSVLADVSTNEKAVESLKTLLADTNAKMYAVIKPIETPLSEAEISAFKALVTNYPNTTILNVSGANMAVRYGIDTKTYIDKKFAELQAMIQG